MPHDRETETADLEVQDTNGRWFGPFTQHEVEYMGWDPDGEFVRKVQK